MTTPRLSPRKNQKFSGGFRGVSALEPEVTEFAEFYVVSDEIRRWSKSFRRRIPALCQCRGWCHGTERVWDDVSATYPIPLPFSCCQSQPHCVSTWQLRPMWRKFSYGRNNFQKLILTPETPSLTWLWLWWPMELCVCVSAYHGDGEGTKMEIFGERPNFIFGSSLSSFSFSFSLIGTHRTFIAGTRSLNEENLNNNLATGVPDSEILPGRHWVHKIEVSV